MKKVAILTTFREDDPAYSLCDVVNDQLKMLVGGDYEPVVLVTKGFKPGKRMFVHPNVELRELPDQVRSNSIGDQAVDDDFNKDVEDLEKALTEKLRDIDVVITHDTVYQPDSVKHRVALLLTHTRALPSLRFMHWIHSNTNPYRLSQLRGSFPERYQKSLEDAFPNSFYIYMNEWSRPRIATNFNVAERHVKIIPHPTDYFTFAKYDADSVKLISAKRLYEMDYVCIYPIRLDTGKKVEVPIKLIATLKKLNFDVRLVVVDFHSSSDDPEDPKFKYRQSLKDLALDWGLNSDELTFTSEFMPEWKVSVPSTVVSDLFDISNIFVMSSESESFSLITQEAAMKNNLLILNQSFPPFREVFGQSAIHWPFGANVDVANPSADGQSTVNYGDADNERKDFEALAKNVIAATANRQNITRRNLLKHRNLKTIFTRHFEPTMNQLFDAFPLTKTHEGDSRNTSI